jgi:hypothetical protein
VDRLIPAASTVQLSWRISDHKPHNCSHRFDLAGMGILLLLCAFIWPTVMVECCEIDQPTLTYPTRGWPSCGRRHPPS